VASADRCPTLRLRRDRLQRHPRVRGGRTGGGDAHGCPPSPPAFISRTRGYLPGNAVESVLEETERLRALLAEAAERADRVQAQAAALRALCSLAAIAVAVGAFVGFWLAAGQQWLLPIALPVSLAVFAAVAGVLERLGLASAWLAGEVRLVTGGI
jgi:hypothetical protein